LRGKVWGRRILAGAPPDWVWDAAIGTWAFRSLAQATYFHARRQGFDGAPPLAAQEQMPRAECQRQRRSGSGS
jgi:hypothetical protein